LRRYSDMGRMLTEVEILEGDKPGESFTRSPKAPVVRTIFRTFELRNGVPVCIGQSIDSENSATRDLVLWRQAVQGYSRPLPHSVMLLSFDTGGGRSSAKGD
jgi:hypothetical protein